jgi:uncharacterized protein YgbK (DUF1537 family)
MYSPTVSSVFAPAKLTVPHPSHVYLLADDLTGACDAAAAFLNAGHSVRVWFGLMALHATPESVQAFSTNSRAHAPKEAILAVSHTAAGFTGKSNSLFFKKIDSAARGPLAAELLAAHRALGTETILVAPSFPAAGRTVSDGILYIRDAAGQDTRLPLAGLFPPEVQPLTAMIARPEEIAAARASGRSILLCDATTQTDLEALAHAAADLPGLLYAGSAGLARAIASIHSASQAPQPLPRSARTLIVTGTGHPVTRLQLEQLAESQRCARVLRIHFEASDAARIRAAFQEFDPQTLILTGGDTALLATRALDAHSFILHGEFAPGIPWGLVQGGAAHGRIILTKSGGFGSPTTLSDILATLSGQR